MTVEQMADDDYFAFDAVDQTALKKYQGWHFFRLSFSR